MSRLDRHIALVRGKLTLGLFLKQLARALFVLFAVVWLEVLVDRLVQVHPPYRWTLLGIGTGVAIVVAWVWAMWKRPSAKRAAVVIDDKLQLQEKFSTALYVRPLNDPFAAAAVLDAEKTADRVSLARRFPVEIPRKQIFSASGMMCAALLTAWLMPAFDLFHVEQNRVKRVEIAHQKRVDAERAVRDAIVQLDNAPKSVADSEAIKLARNELANSLKSPGEDPVVTKQKADSALKQMDAIKSQIRDAQKFAQAQAELKTLQDLPNTPGTSEEINSARDALNKGDLSQAVSALQKTVDTFDQKSQAEQQKTAEDMAKLAAQIAQKANDPNVQKNIQDQLKKMGMSQSQAQQISQAMSAAANGDKASQQMVANAARQLAQQLNSGKSSMSTSQQQQLAAQIASTFGHLQTQANGQAQAQQLSQSASALAQAMKQAAGAGQTQASSKAGQSGQQNGGSQSGQQSGQGPRSGQSAQANAAQQKQQAGQAMQQQMQQMQAMANAAQAASAGQGGSQANGANQGAGNQGNNGNGPGNQGSGQWAAGNPQNQPGAGNGGPGQGMGARPAPQIAPYGVKEELSESQTTDQGKILASSFVKAGTIIGQSKLQLSNAVLKEKQDAADQVDEDRIPRSSASAVKNYFQTIKDDSQ